MKSNFRFQTGPGPLFAGTVGIALLSLLAHGCAPSHSNLSGAGSWGSSSSPSNVAASQPVSETASSTPDQPTIAWETWRDPNEGAFTVEVPQGWNVEGGTYRMSAIDIRTAFRITSPDGGTVLTVGDKDVPGYCLPNPLLEQAGLQRGSIYSMPGSQMVISDYMPGADFAADEVKRTLPSDGSELQITLSQQRPEAAEKINALLAPFAQYGTQAHVDAGEVEYTCQSQGQPRKGGCLAGTLLLQAQAGNGIWVVPFLYGYRTTPEKASQAQALLTHIVTSFQIDPQWSSRQQQTTMDVSHITTQANNEMMNIWRSTTDAQEQAQDRNVRHFDNYIRGQETVVDPQTGETHQVESGHSYYYARPTATQPAFAGNETGTPPDSRYHEVNRVP